MAVFAASPGISVVDLLREGFDLVKEYRRGVERINEIVLSGFRYFFPTSDILG
jgi:hypothetical protein